MIANKKSLHYILAFLLAASAGSSVAACSDDSKSSPAPAETPDEPDEPEDPEDPPKEEQKQDEPDTPPDPKEEPDEGWQALLVANTPTDVEVANEGQTKIGVKLISTSGDSAGEGIPAEKIQWGIESGTDYVSLAVKKSSTNEAGIATVTVNAFDVPGDAVVFAYSDKAPKSVKFNMKVLDVPTGALSVSVEYKGNAPAENYSIKLYDRSEVQCGKTDYQTGSIINWKTEAEAEPIAQPVDGKSAEFDKLSTESAYTIIAYGYSEAGAPVAAGCVDSGTDVFANQTTKVALNLDTIDLDPVTTYHVRSYFDLGDVVSSLGQVGKYMSMISDFAANPGKMAYDMVLKITLEELIGGWSKTLVDAILSATGLKDKLLTYINEQVKSNQATCKAGLFACQFRSLIRSMEFLGSLDIEKEGSIELKGHNAYDGLAVYWRINCTNDPDPNCGRFGISTESIKKDKDINLLDGSWSGSLANGYDKISIESHQLTLKYGEIIVLLLNDFLLPRVTSDKCHNMECAIGHWINADSIAQWLSNTLSISIPILGDISVSKSQAKGWVDKAVSGLTTALNFGTAFVQMQTAGSDIEISGTAMLHDTNADNIIDIIDTGKWSGSMSVTSKSDGAETKTTTAVKGIWSAYNAKNIETDGSMYCTMDKTSSDNDAGQLCHYPELDIESLTSSGMCADYKKCAE